MLYIGLIGYIISVLNIPFSFPCDIPRTCQQRRYMRSRRLAATFAAIATVRRIASRGNWCVVWLLC